MKKLFYYLLAVLIIGTISSCQSEVDDMLNEKHLTSVQLKNDKAIIAKLGFDAESIVDEGDTYVVEGDIVLEKKYLLEYGKVPNENNIDGIVTRQASASYGLVELLKVSHITVRFDDSRPITAEWKAATLAAINSWNSISNCNVKFIYTTALVSDVKIYGYTDYNSFYVAKADVAAGGSPGTFIMINSKYNYFSSGEKHNTMVHEFGHTVGIRHTNWKNNKENPSSVIHIPGTPETDPNSVFNHIVEKEWEGFSEYDLKAIQYLYPSSMAFYDTTPVGNEINAKFRIDKRTKLNIRCVLWKKLGSASQGQQVKVSFFVAGKRVNFDTTTNWSENIILDLAPGEYSVSSGFSYGAPHIDKIFVVLQEVISPSDVKISPLWNQVTVNFK